MCDWCAKNWESVVSVLAAIVIVATIVVVSALTFGTAAVVAAAAVGALAGIGCQLASDIISWKTIRDGTVAQMTDSYMETITNGYIDSFKELNQEKPHVKIDYFKFVNFQC